MDLGLTDRVYVITGGSRGLGFATAQALVAVGAELDQGGSLAFVLSTSVRSPIADLAISNGLRPGLAGVAKSLADELGPRGIRVNGLLPGRIATGRVQEIDSRAGDPDAVRAELS